MAVTSYGLSPVARLCVNGSPDALIDRRPAFRGMCLDTLCLDSDAREKPLDPLGQSFVEVVFEEVFFAEAVVVWVWCSTTRIPVCIAGHDIDEAVALFL